MDSSWPARTQISTITAVLLILLLLSSFRPSTSSLDTSFDLAAFSLRNLTLLGDSYLKNGSIGLTKETSVPSSRSGSAASSFPIAFRDPSTNASASFSTNFSFSISTGDGNGNGNGGDGMSFFVSPHDQILPPPLAGSSGDGVVAVQFDTRVDLVRLDVGGSPAAANAADLGQFGIDLKRGVPIYAWIAYDNDEKMVRVWMNYTDEKPPIPVLAVNYDLSANFEELMYVGFSASTEGSTEVHTVHDWTFQTSGFPNPLNPNPNPSSSSSAAAAAEALPTGKEFSNSSYGSWTKIPSFSDRGGLHKKLSLGLGIAGPIAFFSFFILFVWVLIKKRFGDGDGDGRAVENDDKQLVVRYPRRFTHKELSAATRGFHAGRVVGSGSFGTVYRAVQPGTENVYAVKRSKCTHHQDRSEFLSELSIIASLRHKNLIQLKGWCEEKGELFLVYEFMAHGSLDRVLYTGTAETLETSVSLDVESPEGGASPLGWAHRYNVAVGVASVLTYLHEECEQQVIHRDIKTSNIMLDNNFTPKLGDFGLARSMDHNESPVSTLTAGTLGYLAPEYVQYGKATEKTDVFSFGIVVLEVCCGRRPIDRNHNNNNNNLVNLVDWVWALYAEDKLLEAADRRLNGEFNKEEMLRLLLVGLSCANPDCNQRPSMRRVVQILNKEMEPLCVPKFKPCLTFHCGLPKSLNDIVSEGEGDSFTSSPLQEIKISP